MQRRVRSWVHGVVVAAGLARTSVRAPVLADAAYSGMAIAKAGNRARGVHLGRAIVPGRSVLESLAERRDPENQVKA
jgi:hypothetical protein